MRHAVAGSPHSPRDCELRLGGKQVFDFGCRVWTGTVVIPKELLKNARFTPGLEPAEDRDLWIRTVAAAPVYCLSRPLATAVLEPDSLSRSDIEKDCANMLRVIHAHQNLLGKAGLKEWEAHVYRRWAGVHLAARRPRQAIRPAFAYLRRRPLSLRGWWVLFKSGILSLSSRRATPRRAGFATDDWPTVTEMPKPRQEPT